MAGNTTPIHGRVCRIELSGTLVDFSVDWSINVSVDLVDSSKQGDSWKSNLVGMTGWSGSMTFHIVTDNTEQKSFLDNIITASPGTKLTGVEFTLEDSGDYFSGDLFINSFAITSAVGDIVDCSFEFTGDGALSLTVA